MNLIASIKTKYWSSASLGIPMNLKKKSFYTFKKKLAHKKSTKRFQYSLYLNVTVSPVILQGDFYAKYQMYIPA